MTIYLSRADFVFDAVGLYVIKIVARFYKVQYKHTKRDAMVCSFAFVLYILCVRFRQELAKTYGI